MNKSHLKNIVVLKNLPSNIVEEAIVILKANKKIKKYETIEQNKIRTGSGSKDEEKQYILKEAEMLINNYISKIEGNKNKEIKLKKEKEKQKKIKIYAVTITIICILQIITNIF